MKSAWIITLIILGVAGYGLWYIFVFAQSTTTELKFNQHAVVVGIEACAPRADNLTNKECKKAIKDDIGRYFTNETGNTTKIYFSDKVRAEGILTTPDETTARKYQIDGIIVNTINQ